MMARPSFFSTATALAFMATSIAPIVPPNRNMATAATGTFGASATSSRPKHAGDARRAQSTRLRAVLRDEMAGPDHGADGAGAEHQDQQAEREFGDAEPGQEDRDLRRPAADQKPLTKKIAATAQRPRMAVAAALVASMAARIHRSKRGT